MKTLVLSLLLTCISLSLSAATRTVSNKPGDVAQFTSLQEAVNASSDGDIILISGSPTSYGFVTIAKRLTLIGPGSNPKFNGGANATISTMTINSAQASKSVLQGLKISTIDIRVVDCDEVQIKRCDVAIIVNNAPNSTRIPQKWILEESVFYGNGISNRPDANLSANWSVRNCYLFNSVALNGSIFENNLWYGGNHSGNGNVYTNNIFVIVGFSQVTGGSFANNIFNNAPTIDFNANSSSGNFFSTDPQFVNFSPSNFFAGDVSLKPGSPAINAGTDGTDIGMFGGRGFLITMIPGIPSVQSFIILNPTVPQNGTLNIKVEGKANN